MNNREIAGVKVVVSGETYDEYKGTLQEQIDNLQSKIDKAIEILNDGLKQLDERNRCEVYIEEYLENARDILKAKENKHENNRFIK